MPQEVDVSISAQQDHGLLSGLGDDDHTQYALVDGSRAFTGGITPGNYSDDTRPTATSLPVGTMIWNTSDGAPNFATASGWVDASGAAT